MPTADKKPAGKPTASDEYAGAFWDMMRGSVDMNVRNALSIGEDTEGGYTVPDEFERQFHGLRRTTSSAAWPT